MTDLETDSGRPLTEDERARLRELLLKEGRVTWFWGTLRVWATGLALFFATIYTISDAVKNTAKYFIKVLQGS